MMDGYVGQLHPFFSGEVQKVERMITASIWN